MMFKEERRHSMVYCKAKGLRCCSSEQVSRVADEHGEEGVGGELTCCNFKFQIQKNK